MSRVEVAELVLLAAALAVGLLLVAAILLQYCLRHRLGRRSARNDKPAPSDELPISVPTTAASSPEPADQPTCGGRVLLKVVLCTGRRRARVEPAAANSAAAAAVQEVAVAVEEVDDVARWFGRALYTIQEEEDEECSTITQDDEERPEPETPFYTPPVSPPRLSDQAP